MNDRLDAEEEATQCFIADVDFKYEGLVRKMMKAQASTAQDVELKMIFECKRFFGNVESGLMYGDGFGLQKDDHRKKKYGNENGCRVLREHNGTTPFGTSRKCSG